MKRQILVVDDEEAIRSLFKSLFPEDVYDVHAVEDGREALHLLSNADINVIFLDLKLFGMDGSPCAVKSSDQSHCHDPCNEGWSVLYDLEECRSAGSKIISSSRWN